MSSQERKPRVVRFRESENGPEFLLIDGVKFEIMPITSGPDWHGRYGRRPRPTFKLRPRAQRGDIDSWEEEVQA